MIKLLITILSLFIVEKIVPGFYVDSFWTAVVVAIVLGIINTFIRPILQIIALPVSIATLGISAFLINVGLLMLVDAIVPGFAIANFWIAVMASVAMALVNWFLNKLIKD